ncbi:transcription termination/antitermination protein NusG [Roseovarius ramblicola]|uniref:Transcription termination/antitermination protein NusG n=1 Tax=Roseovarius ramblicola TaxID=2022336 RepID=A0ABV5HXF7_9RHOB
MTAHAHDTAWFLAQLKPNCARIADSHLSRQGFQTFLPLQEETRQRNGRFVTAERPLFPGYIFVALDVARGLWRKVNSTRGVVRLVSFGTAPTAVPAELVSHLMRRCDRSGKLRTPDDVAQGDTVTMTTGPFAGFVTEVERIDPDRRVWVLMEIMGGQKRLSVTPGQLRTL